MSAAPVLDTSGLPSNEKELVEEVKGMNSKQILALRKKAENNLRFFAYAILGMKDVNIDTHGAFCKFIQSDQWPRRLSLMPRLHLKTSIAVEADGLRRGLRDPDNVRMLVVNEVDKNAAKMVSAIMNYCEKNELVRFIWGDVIPTRFTGPGLKWSTEGANLVRKTTFKESTWQATGVGSASGGVSMHYTHIKGDDLIGLESYKQMQSKSEAVLRDAISFVDGLESLVVGADQTIIDFIGTRWFKNDIWGYIIERYGPLLKVFRRKVVENGEIIFPQKITWPYLALQQKRPELYAANFLNDPVAAMLSDFDADQLRSYGFDNDRRLVYSGKRTEWEILDRVVTVDPNSGKATAPDEAVVSAVGMDPWENVFALEINNGRPDPTKFVDNIFDVCMKWRPRVVLIEEAGQQNTLHYFKEKCSKERMFFNVVGLPRKPQDKKEYRIRTALQPVIAAGKMHFLPSQDAARTQVQWFPDTKNDDILDTLADAVVHLRRPSAIEEIEEEQKAVEKVLSTRSKITGY